MRKRIKNKPEKTQKFTILFLGLSKTDKNDYIWKATILKYRFGGYLKYFGANRTHKFGPDKVQK